MPVIVALREAVQHDESGPNFVWATALNEAETECIGECRDRRCAAVLRSAALALHSAAFHCVRRLMTTPPPTFVTVDMRGLKAPLVACALARRVSVSVLVRGAVARHLGLAEADFVSEAVALASKPTSKPASTATSIKLSIRMTAVEAAQLTAGARTAGLSRGAYLSGLVANVPVLTAGASRPDHIAALVASSAELSTLTRNLHQLTTLLRQGQVQPALRYRALLDTLAGDVRAHLVLAARTLANLQPRTSSASTSMADASAHPTT
jgi:hypothetical protein